MKDIDLWHILVCFLCFIIGYLAIENYKLKKFKRLWQEHGKNSMQQQIDSMRDRKYGKQKIKDVN